jgi:NSS family neurotransmitter:Na+ symporter
MVDEPSGDRENWSGALGFILAAVGSAVGLGNVWRFPYVAAENGGGAFVLIYLACIAVVGLPLLIAEMKLGRRTERGPVGAYAALSPSSIPGALWVVFGLLAVVTGFVLLSYYSVVGGWAVAYSGKAMMGQFAELGSGEAGTIFGAYTGSVVYSTVSHAIFMAISIGIVFGGVSDGIERAAKILMPTFGLLLIILFGYALTTSGSAEAFSFMFAPKWDEVTTSSVLQALGQSFFTLSLGMGAIMVYGSYLGEDDELYGSSVTVAAADTSVALIAGIVIYSIIFTEGGDPSQTGPGLAFVAMPQLFSQMPGGTVLSTLFFVLLTFAAVSSAMSLLEVVTSYFIEELGYERKRAAIWFGFAIFLLGIPSVLGFSVLGNVTWTLGGEEKNILGILDYFVVNFALPLGGFGAGAFAGWVVRPEEWFDEVGDESVPKFIVTGWIWLVRTAAPLAIILVLLNKVGVIG